jgi:MGT family glycosyltransferase
MGTMVFFNVPSAGHVNPSLPLVQALVQRGERVLVYLTEGYRARFEALGAEFRPYPGLRDDFFEAAGLDGSNPPGTALHLIETSTRLIPQIIEAVRAEAPRAVLYDAMCPWGNVIGQMLGVPRISSMALLFTDARSVMASIGLTGVAGMLGRGAGALLRFPLAAARLARATGTRPLRFPETLINPADLVISYTAEAIQPNAQAYGSHVRYVGPSLAARGDGDGFPFDALDERPLILASLGTVINNHPEFFRTALTAFADWQVQLVLSIGSRVDAAALGPIPANAIVRGHVPQLALLERAAIFITHGGMNSVHEALYYGVPMLLAPQQIEQRATAQRLQQLGAGILLPSPSPSPTDLREAAGHMFARSDFRARASELGELLRAAGGQHRAAQEIVRFVEAKSSEASV